MREPPAGGASSSMRSSSMVFMSTTKCRPSTGLAYGLPFGVERRHTSVQPTRRSWNSDGDQGVPVGPRVDEDEVEVGDAALGEGRDDVGVLDQRLVRLVPLVQGHVGLLAGHGLPGEDGVVGQRDQRLVGGALVAAPAGDPCLAADRVAGGEGADDVLGRLPELDRGEAPALVDAAVPAQDGGGRAELVGGERVERVRGHVGGLPACVGRSASRGRTGPRPGRGSRDRREVVRPGSAGGGRSRTAPRGRRGWPAPR